MSAPTTRLRRALHAAADALADVVEEMARAPVEAPSNDTSPKPALTIPNNDVARAAAQKIARERGWPLPKAR